MVLPLCPRAYMFIQTNLTGHITPLLPICLILTIVDRAPSMIPLSHHATAPLCLGNNFSNIMGACAGCMGPNRRANNYQVNRLTENSPIKSRVSVAELPSRHKERILEELNESKRRYEQNNLIGTLINASPILPDKQLPSRMSRIQSPESFARDSYQKESYPEEGNRSTGILKLKKVQSTFVDRKPQPLSLLDQNNERLAFDRPLFVSEFRTDYQRPHSKVLAEIRLNKNDVGLSLKKKGMPNIPELADEQVKTPNYIKDMRKQNGEDVKPSNLESIPRQLDPAPRLNLGLYLKDLNI